MSGVPRSRSPSQVDGAYELTRLPWRSGSEQSEQTTGLQGYMRIASGVTRPTYHDWIVNKTQDLITIVKTVDAAGRESAYSTKGWGQAFVETRYSSFGVLRN